MTTKFIQKHYCGDSFNTHVSMVEPKGKYQLGRESIEKLWNIYDPSERLGLAEKPQYYIPVLCDCDIKIEESNVLDIFEKNDFEETDRFYSLEQLESVVDIYQCVLREIVEDISDDKLLCVVLEKKIYSYEDKGKVFYKNGFHLHFPGCFLSKTDQETHLITRVKQRMKESEIFSNLLMEDSSSVIDGGYCSKPWLLYGSRKDGLEPYEVSRVIDCNGRDVEIEDAFSHYQLFDMREQLININGKVDSYLPRILSIIPYGRNTCEIKHGIPLPGKELKLLDKISNNNEKKEYSHPKMSVIEALKVSSKLLPMLSNFRATEYDEWFRIGCILYNISEGSEEGLDQWLEFSSRDEDKYDELICRDYWNKMVKKDYTIGTLKYLVTIDNPESYDEYKKEKSDEYLKKSLEGSHNDIAKILYVEYGSEFVCASVLGKTWFQFHDHIWEEIEEGVFLRERISEDIIEKYADMGRDIFTKIAGADKAEEAMHQVRVKQLQKLISNLKSHPYKRNVMNEAADIFYNKNFKVKLDINPNLIAFKNGVYDLKVNKFRAGLPEDYLSKKMPINYIEFSYEDQRVKDVQKFLEQIFPDKSVRTYFLDTTSDVFEGGNKQKIGIFWTGEGDNGKSVTQTIMEQMLGEYAIKIDTGFLTGKKSSIGAASPEMSRAGGGVRWAVFEEPNKDEEINGGTFKKITGNDSYWARDLFEKGKSTREITPLFMTIFICNYLPRFSGGTCDQAIWNRVRVIPFESTFVRAGEPCPGTYEEQLLQKRFPMDTNFYSKIPDLLEPLAWLLLEHRKHMTVRIEPEKVKMATSLYRKQNDIYRQFMEERIIDSPDSFINIDVLNASFKEWYKDEGFSSNTIPLKSEVKEYFTKLWGEPTKTRWQGFKIRTIKDDINDGSAKIIPDDELVVYENEEDYLPPL